MIAMNIILNIQLSDYCFHIPQAMNTLSLLDPLVPELFGRAQKNLIFHREIEHYSFIILTLCLLGKPHSNHISLNRPRVWDSAHFMIEKIE